MKIVIKVKNTKEAKCAAKLIHDITKLPYYRSYKSEDDIAEVFKDGIERCVLCDGVDIFVSKSLNGWGNIPKFEYATQPKEILDYLLLGDKYIVTNVGEYDAQVTKDGVIVGCQKIPFDKIRELVKVIDEFEKDNK